jgi:ribonuclease D
VLSRLLEHDSIQKVFHYALFDVSFMARWWNVKPRNIACTKVASRVLAPEGPHSLQDLLAAHLGIRLNKSDSRVRTSDWRRETLLDEQIEYAANDVRYLLALHDKLQTELGRVGRTELAQQCFAFLPKRVQLEISGTGDPFRY